MDDANVGLRDVQHLNPKYQPLRLKDLLLDQKRGKHQNELMIEKYL